MPATVLITSDVAFTDYIYDMPCCRYPKDDPGPGYEDAVDCEECHPVSSHSARDQTDQEGSGAAM